MQGRPARSIGRRSPPEYAPCADGVRQSPVDIAGYGRTADPALSFSYDGGVRSVALVRGSVVVEFEPGSGLALGGRAANCCRPTPTRPPNTRWTASGFAAELHAVHEDASGTLVVGVLYRLGDASPVLQAMLDAVAGAGEFPLDAGAFAPRSTAFYSYTGSKTTPPCQEPVAWAVMRNAETASQEQVEALQSLSGGPNNRPLQPLRGRSILLVGG